ncbi:transposase [Centipeda periodontii DSM 2778]|uniref:Transposase n=1 Tax=Centipeda periodontii DSM 2778 TaxID=888060 RepID=F5RKJ7_9FIRM|nr:hypothetical protein [Centipeda periodontii]EGK60925.1 transposase [Centipeda periodontii DSM 2778]
MTELSMQYQKTGRAFQDCPIAGGFHTFEGYAAMIYLVAGKLKLATPVLKIAFPLVLE